MGKCNKCGRIKTTLSHKRLCRDCSEFLKDLAVAQMKAKEGRAWEKWKLSMKKFVEGYEISKGLTRK